MAEEPGEKVLSVGVLGAGSHSRTYHGPALRILRGRRPDLYELSAVCDLDPARAREYAQQFGFARSYGGLEEMLAGEHLDALVAVTPMEQTLPIASRILRARVPVLIEKPPGLNTDEARRLLAVAEETGTAHMVSFNRRFCPAVMRARRWLRQQEPSRPVRMIAARMFRHKRREDNFVAHTGIHLVDTVLSFLGAPRRVQASRVDTGRAGSHLYEATLAFDSGAAATLLFASAVGRQEETYDVLGEDFHVRIEALDGQVEIFDAGKPAVDWTAPPEEPPAAVNGTLAETQEFLECVAAGRAMHPDLKEAMESFTVAETIQHAT